MQLFAQVDGCVFVHAPGGFRHADSSDVLWFHYLQSVSYKAAQAIIPTRKSSDGKYLTVGLESTTSLDKYFATMSSRSASNVCSTSGRSRAHIRAFHFARVQREKRTFLSIILRTCSCPLRAPLFHRHNSLRPATRQSLTIANTYPEPETEKERSSVDYPQVRVGSFNECL